MVADMRTVGCINLSASLGPLTRSLPEPLKPPSGWSCESKGYATICRAGPHKNRNPSRGREAESPDGEGLSTSFVYVER